ncbi:MAG: metallophosphoesterase [Clostridia bacterium]|nr:metallophosphoesterase [Clostridia bacterium]
MKIYAIADLHLSLCGQKPMEVFGENWDNYTEIIREDWKNKVTDEDIVLIAGDISWAMKLEEFQLDLKFFEGLKGKKVFIRGNHDYWWDSISKVRNALEKDMYAVQNDCLKFENYIICGTRGWIVPERNQTLSDDDQKIYNREIERTILTLNAMQKIRQENDKVIFMIHYPPFNSARNQNEFLDLFEKYKVDVVVYGHLHGKHVKTSLYERRNDIDFYLTSTDQINHKMVEIKI